MAKLAIDQIEATAGTQVRVKIDEKVVNEYAEAIKDGAMFPPLVVFAPKNSQRYILADGFHRLRAAIKVDRKTVGVKIKEGGVHEALHYALGANAEHGLRRSNDDKRNAVMLAFKDPNYDDWSLRQIADLCRVSHILVKNMKAEQNQKVSDASVNINSNGPVTPRSAFVGDATNKSLFYPLIEDSRRAFDTFRKWIFQYWNDITAIFLIILSPLLVLAGIYHGFKYDEDFIGFLWTIGAAFLLPIYLIGGLLALFLPLYCGVFVYSFFRIFFIAHTRNPFEPFQIILNWRYVTAMFAGVGTALFVFFVFGIALPEWLREIPELGRLFRFIPG